MPGPLVTAPNAAPPPGARRKAKDAGPDAEHRLTVSYDGDFNMAGFVKHVHRLGSIGASRDIVASDENDKPVKFGWDGDGADKIRSAEIDGVDILKEKTSAQDVATDSAIKLALDREGSNRVIDRDGRMRVLVTNICKACVSPYRGEEIPGYEELGLDKDKIYQMLRPPDELQKAAASSNGIQLLRQHIPVNADDHQPWDVAGSVGTNAEWADPFVTNSLSIWVARDIEGIESGSKVELSPGYHYEPVMEPGDFNGEPYDGRMTDIVFNHVAIVTEGRQGKDVVVGDSADDLNWGIIERALMDIGENAGA